jgi:hypothetical protein
MRSITGALASAVMLLACAKHDSNDSSVVNFMAVDTSNGAASITFEAFAAADPTKVVASQKIGSFSGATAGREFTGDLVVDPGAYVFRAFSFDSGGAPLGGGEAEDGNPITTIKDGKTSVSITILPYAQQAVGPIISSFVATPTGSTIPVNTPVTLTATVAYHGTGTLTYHYAQNCAHGVFSTPTDGLTATWSDPEEETCQISFTVTDPGSGASDVRSVSISCSCLGTSQAGQALVVCGGNP